MIKLNLESELSIMVDVDDTLVSNTQCWFFKRPIVYHNTYKNKTCVKYVSDAHLEFVKDLFARGYQITVWSHGGAQYAYDICLALGLEMYVYEARAKASKVLDDKHDVQNVVGARLHLKE